ncbi:MAG: hypothetical protein EAZ85_01455 [Bacteroidetes bacterium]|nr:MAG: hypothetical protein EAZ85_01455 [Bacteroidota bacterium]TAG89385.1 MAG: hypothetical protein EAZ20_06585 [Bacteroidota bacterium]
MKPFFCLIFIHLFFGKYLLLAQFEPLSIGARSQGMGQIQTTITDSWAIFNNIGQLGKLKQKEAMIAYTSRFQTNAFQTIAAGYVHQLENKKDKSNPKKLGTIGLGIEKFGDNLYHELKIGIGYGINIENAGIGIRINYIQQYYQQLGTRGNISIDVGSQVRVHKNWYIAGFVSNLNNTELSSDYGANLRIPTIMRAGILYEPLENIKIATEIEKDLRFLPLFRMGIEYEWRKNWCIRTGFSPEPSVWSAGLGWKSKKWIFDYALQPRHLLGISHHFSLIFKIF